MLGYLPVGVVGIDENGLIAHCNSVASTILIQLCDNFLGTDIEHFCDRRLKDITEQVLRTKKVVITDTFGDRDWKVLGRTITFADSEAVVLVFLEV
jgi:nitrogen fixation/metabolism regulation signal transduction histidine kinase